MRKIQDKKINSLSEVKQIYESGKYFSDAYSWYCDRFLAPYSERVFLFFISVISFGIVIVVAITIFGLFPLNESFPVLVKQKDLMFYTPVIKRLKPKNIDYTSNESLARYLSIEYIKSLLNNDFSTGDLNMLQSKLDKIKLSSSKSVYEKARLYLNKLFKNNINQKVSINTLKFINSVNDIYNFDKQSYKIEVTCTFYNTINKKITKKTQKIILTFKFSNINYDERNNKFRPIEFLVIDFIIKSK